jgi:glutamate 5-kinase
VDERPLADAGAVVIDDGARLKVREGGKSLLPIGVVEIQGEFHRGDVIAVRSLEGVELARGLANYSSSESPAHRTKAI